MNRNVVSAILFVLSLSTAAAVHSAEGIRVVDEGSIRDQWMLAQGVTLAAPGYPAAFAARGDNVCVAMGYAINPDGTTSDFNVLKVWNSSGGKAEPVEGFYDAFARTSAAALAQWKFQKRPEVNNPQPVYTVATLHFMGKEAVDVSQLREHCKIVNLAGVLVKSKITGYEIPSQSRLRRDIDQGLRHVQGTQSLIEDPGRSAGNPVY